MRLSIPHLRSYSPNHTQQKTIKSLEQCLVVGSAPFFMIGCILLFLVQGSIKALLFPFILASIVSYMGYRYIRRQANKLFHPTKLTLVLTVAA